MDGKLIIALVRHGEYHQPLNVPSALLPYALTQNGENQARECAAILIKFAQKANLKICTGIDCSHMLRAWQTASIMGRCLTQHLNQDFEINEFDCLSERSVGAAANLTIEEIETLLEKDPRYASAPEGWKSSSLYQLPFQGAESLEAAGRRVAMHLTSLKQTTGEMKLIVGHGAAIRHAAVHLGVLAASRVGLVSMFHATPVFIGREAGSDTMQWNHIEGNWKIRADKSGDEFNAR
jgi:2,3-bisphosphoglycerate-dependent phosphoglycerate mutase